jgi:hypothetical protein
MLLLAAASCAAPRVAQRSASQGWRLVHRDDESVSYHHTGGGTMAASTSCDDADDVPLTVLTNHILIGVEARREHSRVPLVIAGRAALRTRVDGTVDGVGVTLDLVVLKKDGCTYDLVLVTAPAAYAQRRPDFERFIAAFTPPRRP